MSQTNWAVNGLGGLVRILEQLQEEGDTGTRHAREEIEKLCERLLELAQKMKGPDE